MGRPSTIGELIIGLERAALDRWGRGDPSGYLDLYADDVRYFDPTVGSRLDGLAAMEEFLRPVAGKMSIRRYEMLNPEVAVVGEMALLTYNLVNFMGAPDARECMGSRWNCTEVYRRRDGTWKIVHSHWSFTAPSVAAIGTPEAASLASLQ